MPRPPYLVPWLVDTVLYCIQAWYDDVQARGQRGTMLEEGIYAMGAEEPRVTSFRESA